MDDDDGFLNSKFTRSIQKGNILCWSSISSWKRDRKGTDVLSYPAILKFKKFEKFKEKCS